MFEILIATSAHTPTGEGAGMTCFQRNCLFTFVGFVMLYATHSLQVCSSKTPNSFLSVIQFPLGECGCIAYANGCPARSHPSSFCCTYHQRQASYSEGRCQRCCCSEQICQRHQEQGYCCTRYVAAPSAFEVTTMK